MQYLQPYLVTSTDYFGNDYQHTVYLTIQDAADRIVNGRLLTPAQARSRNYKRLWDKFKALEKQPGSGYIPQDYVAKQSEQQILNDEY